MHSTSDKQFASSHSHLSKTGSVARRRHHPRSIRLNDRSNGRAPRRIYLAGFMAASAHRVTPDETPPPTDHHTREVHRPRQPMQPGHSLRPPRHQQNIRSSLTQHDERANSPNSSSVEPTKHPANRKNSTATFFSVQSAGQVTQEDQVNTSRTTTNQPQDGIDISAVR